MSEDVNYEVNLSLLELRGFPPPPSGGGGSSYRVEASLKDAVQSTEDAVFSGGHFLLKEELSWTLSRGTYHALRSRKVPIRLSIFEASPQGKEKRVGHLVLDLKEGFPLPSGTKPTDFFASKAQFSRILGAKKNPALMEQPSLKWLLSITTLIEESTPIEPAPHASEAKKEVFISEETEEEDLQAVLNDKEGFFIIGKEPWKIFHLNIEIYFASNLHLAINSDLLPLLEESTYYFSYDILGETVTTLPFTDLKEPNFNVEEATIKIHSSFDELVQYFAKQPPLCISVCSTKFVLARMYFSLSQMLEMTKSNLREKQCLRSSRVFPFEKNRDSSMGVSISLKYKGPAAGKQVSPVPQDTVDSMQMNNKPILGRSPVYQTNTESEKSTSTNIPIKNTSSLKADAVKSKEVSYELIIDLTHIQFDANISKSIRIRYKYLPLMKDEEIDTYDFQVSPNVRKAIPYGKCQLVFTVVPSLCYQVLKTNPLTVNVLDVKNRFKVIGQSQIELSQVLLGQLISDKSKKVDIKSPVHNLVKREIGTLESTIYLLVKDSTSSPIKPKPALSNDQEEWKLQEHKRIEEHLRREWERRESQRAESINANLLKYDKLEKTVQDYINKHQSLESSMTQKDNKINELRTKLTTESSRLSRKLGEAQQQILSLKEKYASEIARGLAKNKELERELDNLKRTQAKKDKIIKDLRNDNARVSQSNDRLMDEVARLKSQLTTQGKEVKNSAGPERNISEDLDSIPSKSVSNNQRSSIDHSIEQYQRSLSLESDIRRLMREKEAILNTGDYTEDDDLVQSITHQINALSIPRNNLQ